MSVAAALSPKGRAERFDAGPLASYNLNEFRIHEVSGRSIGVVRTRRGVYAVRNQCPHMGAEICRGKVTGTLIPSAPGERVYGLDDELIRCPWHRFEFFLETGLAAFGVTTKRLITYPVSVEAGQVYVTLKARPDRQSGTGGSDARR